MVALGLGFASDARADDKKPEKPKPAAEPKMPLVIQIDASKLPPDVLKQLLQLAEKPGGKPDTKPAAEPVKPGTKPGGEKVVKPESKPEVKPGEKVIKPGSQDEIIQRLEKLSIQIEGLRRSIQK
ncbi:MAG: hypothetical protein C0501_21685 [Isosphaera sp.]|nr:hypothetical protein [Isosphaera sp.]